MAGTGRQEDRRLSVLPPRASPTVRVCRCHLALRGAAQTVESVVVAQDPASPSTTTAHCQPQTRPDQTVTPYSRSIVRRAIRRVERTTTGLPSAFCIVHSLCCTTDSSIPLAFSWLALRNISPSSATTAIPCELVQALNLARDNPRRAHCRLCDHVTVATSLRLELMQTPCA